MKLPNPVTLDVSVDTSDAEKKLKRITKAMLNATDAMKRLNDELSKCKEVNISMNIDNTKKKKWFNFFKNLYHGSN